MTLHAPWIEFNGMKWMQIGGNDIGNRHRLKKTWFHVSLFWNRQNKFWIGIWEGEALLGSIVILSKATHCKWILGNGIKFRVDLVVHNGCQFYRPN